MRRIFFKSGLTLLAAAVLSACGPSAGPQISAVTPLPPASTNVTTTIALAATLTPAPTVQAAASPIGSPATTLPATPAPLDNDLPAGSAAAIALAADVLLKPEIAAPLIFDQSPVPITFAEFYDGFDIRKGLALSNKLLSLDGQQVVMEGYMAPPLKPALDWFVLTRVRLEFCPFCSSDADWPMDIALIYLQDDSVLATQAPVRIHGQMEIGRAVDPESGMISLVRIYADKIEVLQPS